MIQLLILEKVKVWTAVVVLLFSISIYGCAQTPSVKTSTKQKHFKTEVPYEVSRRGIMIDTYWGKDSAKHRMLWDNQSPTWVNDDVIRSNKSISKSREYKYRTATADGEAVSGDVYECDQVTIGGISYNSVKMYHISSKHRGSIGEDIIRTGVWRVDIPKGVLTFASSFDSLETTQDAEILPSSFSDTGFIVQLDFGNDFRKSVQLDFGYNGGVLLAQSDFEKVTKGSKNLFFDSLRFTTPGASVATKVTHVIDTFLIGGQKYSTLISTNDRARIGLIGYGFFSQFRYVILDYPRKRVYVIKGQN